MIRCRTVWPLAATVLTVLLMANSLHGWGIGIPHSQDDRSHERYRFVRTDTDAKALPGGTTHISFAHPAELTSYRWLPALSALTHVRLSYINGALADALRECESLESLEVAFHADGDFVMFPSLPHLKSLVLRKPPAHSESLLSSQFPALESLVVYMSEFPEPMPFPDWLLTSHKKLQQLEVRWGEPFETPSPPPAAWDPDELMKACGRLTTLQNLELSFGWSVYQPTTDSFVALEKLTLLQSFALSVESVRTREHALDPKLLQWLSPRLNELRINFEWGRADDQAMKQILRFKELASLRFGGSLSNEAFDVMAMELGPRLKCLEYFGIWPSNAAKYMSRFKSLEVLRTSPGLARSPRGLTPEIIASVAGNLRSLRLDGAGPGSLTSALLVPLADAAHLASLSLLYCEFLPEHVAAVCKVFARITKLTLEHCSGLRSEGYPVVRALKKLEHLAFRDYSDGFTGDFAEAFASLPCIVIQLDCWTVDDRAIAAFAKSASLTSLMVVGVHQTLSPEVFLRMRTCKTLAYLRFSTGSRKPVSVKLAAELRATMPTVNIQIMHIGD